MTKRRIIILMIFLIPAAWAGVVQVFVRRSPPSVAITVAMGDLLAAIGQIENPNPNSEPYQLRYDLTLGDTWFCDIEAIPSASGDDLDQIIGGDSHEISSNEVLNSGQYKIEVVEQQEQKWRLRIEAIKGGSLSQPYECWLDNFGTMTVSSPSPAVGSVRDDLFRKTGIFLAGPFANEVRARERCGNRPSKIFGLRTQAMAKRLQLHQTQDRMPPKGGLIFMGPLSHLEQTNQFRVLSYRRVELANNQWEGFVELLVRANYQCNSNSLHLLTGEARVRDIVDLQKERRIGVSRENTLLIKQTMRAREGD